ncbi:rubredoxin [Mucilaginibacter sp. UR6-1]|uniref:rubredoxin domain-containing protein n=1 Tax=Mucilaginibacter sp. UR6-1 TaxID=1435643 RepID=UPI001E3D1EEE|nr:rubredoxin domain-containing protein [Mucilaginibacter sp. UR6-1]MCC8409175.1 rubredoxin [Mucilaginibacter sp. UR6-1]
MSAHHVVKINLPGGYVSAGDLHEMLVIAEQAGAVDVRFGNRQQLYFTVEADRLDDMEADMLRDGIDYELDADEYPNIMSSYVCDSIFTQEGWLREGVYRDIFDMFRHKPRLKINIVDRHQTFVPFFSGNFNFISSDVSNYWYWYIRYPKSSWFYCWPSLIYSDDIPLVSKAAEEVILKNKNLFYDVAEVSDQHFYDELLKQIDIPAQAITEPLLLPDFYLPYYEGFNKYTNKYWLGIYRRKELFSLSFLKDVCRLCIQTRVGQIYTTPWKSVIIKDIGMALRNDWGMILDKHRLNVRHASNELNWQIEDLSDEGLALKQQLVRDYEEADLRTYRLSFVIKTRPKTGLMGAIIIKKQSNNAFEIMHTLNFNPNSKEYISHKKNVERADLSSELIALCHTYYSLLLQDVKAIATVPEEQQQPQNLQQTVYECRFCKTVYDSAYGDTDGGIPAGTEFAALKDDYSCPVCESPKQAFELVARSW